MMRQLRKKSQWGIILLVLGALTLAGAGGAWGLSAPSQIAGDWNDFRQWTAPANIGDPQIPIVASDGWQNSQFKISWNIYPDGGSFIITDPNIFTPGVYKSLTYEYTIQLPTNNGEVVKELSHIIFQVTEHDYAADHFRNFKIDGSTVNLSQQGGPKLSYDGPQEFTPGGSNPNMPSNLFGIKFNTEGNATYTFSFETFKAPEWGDFYAKDGTDQQGTIDVTAWNAGFGADPSVATDKQLFIVRANEAEYGVVPLPGAVLLLGAGLSRLVFHIRKKKA